MQLNPEEILDAEKFIFYEKGIKSSELVPITLNLINRGGKKVCDIGGATGVFLNELVKKCNYDIECFLVEIDKSYIEQLANPSIKFIHTSILRNDLSDNCFDIVTFRHILHHLVSDNIKDTLDNQNNALREIFRIIKPGGFLVFQEQINNVKLFSRIVFYLSLFANRHKLNLRYFDAGKVVVSFMTKSEIDSIIEKHKDQFDLEVSQYNYTPWKMPLKWILTILMSRVGHVTYVIKVNK